MTYWEEQTISGEHHILVNFMEDFKKQWIHEPTSINRSDYIVMSTAIALHLLRVSTQTDPHHTHHPHQARDDTALTVSTSVTTFTPIAAEEPGNFFSRPEIRST